MTKSSKNMWYVLLGTILSFLCFLYMVNPLFGFGTFLYGCYDSSLWGNIVLNIVLPTALMVLVISCTSFLAIRKDLTKVPLPLWIAVLSLMVSITIIYMVLVYHFIAPAAYDFSLDASGRYIGFRISFIFSFLAIPACCLPIIILISKKVQSRRKQVRQN